MIASIEKLLEHDRAGCPSTGLQWTRRTTGKVSTELAGLGISVSPNTVGRILRELGFALRVNHKKLSSRSDPERDAQFRHIAALRQRFTEEGQPIISIGLALDWHCHAAATRLLGEPVGLNPTRGSVALDGQYPGRAG